MTRGRGLAALGALLSAGLVLAPATPAAAHPLGNATVNHYDGLHLYPDRIDDQAVEDIAEIPTLQRKGAIDTDHDGTISTVEAATYAHRQCAALSRSDVVSVAGHRLPLAVGASAYTERPGAIQLRIGRLTCSLSAAVSLQRPATVTVDDRWDGAGIGWHEITAVATDVTLHDSPFPARSISDQLLHYPNDLLSSPIDVRSGSISTTPGAGASTYALAKRLPAAGFAVRALNRLANAFNSLVGRRHVTVAVGVLALLLSMLLGAGHACLPGHGKTIMAAYLVGRDGRRRDVVTVGATVTLTHTFGVLILGALISATTFFAPTEAEQDLAVVSGLTVAAVGLVLLVSAVRRRRGPGPLSGLVPDTRSAAAAPPAADLVATGDLVAAGVAAPLVATVLGAGAPQPHRHDHPRHGHPHGQGHHHPHPHPHPAAAEPQRFGRGGLVGLGIAGGLVPSPSALLVLLATIALGRTAFGVVLVLGYGVGMAATLTVAGLLLVRMRNRLARSGAAARLARLERLGAALPVLTAVMVTLVGGWLTLRAVGGTV